MNSLEVQEVQKEVSLLKSAVEVLHDEVRALKKKLKVIVYVKCRCTLTHNALITPHTHKIVGFFLLLAERIWLKSYQNQVPMALTTTDMP